MAVTELGQEEAIKQQPDTSSQGGGKDPLEQAYLNPYYYLGLQENLQKENPDVFNQVFYNGMSDPVSLFDRIRSDIKGDVSRLGEFNFLESVYGKGNVINTYDNQTFLVREGPGYGFVGVDPEEGFFNFAQIPEMSGEAIMIGPSIFTSNPIYATLLSGVGETAKQTIAATIPGEDDISVGERGMDVAIESVMGGVGQKIANGVINFFNKLGVRNFVTKNAIKTLRSDDTFKKDFYKRGLELEELIGPLTLAEKTGENTLRGIEDFLRTYYLTRGVAEELRGTQLSAAKNAINKFLKSLNNATEDPIALRKGTIGTNITNAYKQVLDNFVDIRRKNADENLGKMFNLTDETGKAILDSQGKAMTIDPKTPVIDITSVNKVLNDMLNQAKDYGDDSLQKALIIQMDKINAKAIDEKVPIDFFQSKLQEFGAASAGTGSAFKDLDRAFQKLPAKRIFSALNTALDDTIKMLDEGNGFIKGDQVIDAQLAKNLKTFRTQYKADSELIDTLESSFVKDFIDPAGSKSSEAVFKRFQKLSPDELTFAFNLLNKADKPELISQIKRGMIEDVFTQSKKVLEDLTVESGKLSDDEIMQKLFDPLDFIKRLETSVGEENLKIMFKPGELKQIQDVVEYIQRVNFQNVSAKANVFDVVVSFLNPKQLLARSVGLTKMADLLLSKSGRESLMKTIEALESGKATRELPKKALAAIFDLTLELQNQPYDFLEAYLSDDEYADIVPKKADYEAMLDEQKKNILSEDTPLEKDPNAPNIIELPMTPVPNVDRGQGNVLNNIGDQASLSGPLNPQTLSSLQSVGMPLFQAKEGGLASLDMKNFKKPQVVA
tara:strand:- start:984 stop:3491 length:2508 start_codon:yes stop_codon:yes gene_type:complete